MVYACQLRLRGAGQQALGACVVRYFCCCFDFEPTCCFLLQFKELAERHGNPNTISRAEMQEAIQAVGIVESDGEVILVGPCFLWGCARQQRSCGCWFALELPGVTHAPCNTPLYQ